MSVRAKVVEHPFVDADGVVHSRRSIVEVPRAVAEYHDMFIYEDEGATPSEEDLEEYVCGYPADSGDCSRRVGGPDETCWQHPPDEEE